MSTVKIADKIIGENHPVFIIAEAGVNHNGDINLARKLVDVAAEVGADAVKFQTFKAEKIVTPTAPKAEYQKVTTGTNESQLEMIKKLELNMEAHKKLINHCNRRGILFLSSPFDLESIDLLSELGLEIFKIPSGEITNLPYLKKIGCSKKKIILSTGMSTLNEVKEALDILTQSGSLKEDITVLHCNTEYPTPFKDVNLRAMLTLKKELNVNVGYSDHTVGIEVPIAVTALGATVIEKHFTLDRNMEGPDHKASLEPSELKTMIDAIRNIEISMGDGIKNPSKSELKNMLAARKSIVAAKPIKKGEVISEHNLTVKRPGIGISPMKWNEVIDRKTVRDFKKDELID
jgi:N,N'-diacetyllegionaminate synthase